MQPINKAAGFPQKDKKIKIFLKYFPSQQLAYYSSAKLSQFDSIIQTEV